MEERPSQKKVVSEAQREREFYRYFEPILSWTANGPQCCDLGDEAAIKAHKPVPCPDSALTAFCQLGAFRVGVRRALLFFYDTSYAYILAEATRTLSLVDDSIQDIDDGIWLGHAKIPRGHSVCEHKTLHLQPREGHGPAADDNLVHIINDLRESEFCGSPFVTAALPKARFYAGVPIRTSRGINIGAYCLIDDKPREGLKDNEKKFLRQMGMTVMNHLEMVRAKAQHERATRMVAGIGYFVDGAVDLGRGENEESANTLRSGASKTHLRHQSLRGVDSTESTTANTPQPPNSRHHSGGSSGSAGLREIDTPPRKSSPESPIRGLPFEAAPTSTDSGQPSLPGAQGTGSDSTQAGKRADDLRAELVSSNVRKTFERAAAVLRDAIDVDGAMFFDASPSSYGGLVDGSANASSQTGNHDRTSDASLSSANERKSTHEQSPDPEGPGQPEKYCSVLSSACILRESAAYGTQINEKFLKGLLRRYPKGKIWNFSAQGVSSSDDDSRSDINLPLVADSASKSLTRKKERKRSRIEDGKRIAEHFPRVRSLAITGLWNQATGRWHAASVVWTCNRTRLLTEDLDLPYLQAFSDVLMAEVHRIEAQKSDRAKVDFISSISHELRSPLHGILGSAEAIQEQGTDELNEELVNQIEACGRTLLDIVDNLLDFSKINYYGRTTQKNLQSDTADRQDQLTVASKSSQLGSMMSLDTEVSLDLVTEEVVDSTFYSFCCSQEKKKISHRRVAIILDIDRGPDVDWWCRIALGGWKRIIINLVANALKYTEEGFIHVSLKRQPGRNRKKHNAVLTIKDSGHGMSKAFLQNRLFSAFAQEDSFADGNGLGMNLVSTIVRAIGGKIEVQSEPDVGTAMMVRVPLEAAPNERTGTSADRDKGPVVLDGVTLGLPSMMSRAPGSKLGGSRTLQTSNAMVIESVVKTCSEIGVRTISFDTGGSQHADVLLITEDLLGSGPSVNDDDDNGESEAKRSARDLDGLDTPVIILCNNEIRLRELRPSQPALLPGRHVELIRQPAGPRRVVKAIRACLNAHQKKATTTSLGKHERKGLQTTNQFPNRPKVRDDIGRGVDAGPQENSGLRKDAAGTMESIQPSNLSPRVNGDSGEGHTDRLSAFEDREPSTLTNTKSASDEGSPTARRPNSRTKPAPAPNRADSGLTLLLVDDNAINLQLLSTYTSRNGHLGIRAHNGQHAVDAYKAACEGLPLPAPIAAIQTTADDRILRVPQKPRVILMDINMPVLNGYEATQRIREFERSRGLTPSTVVALTGLGSAEAQQEAYSSGIDLFLTKPVKLKELGRILDGIEREGVT